MFGSQVNYPGITLETSARFVNVTRNKFLEDESFFCIYLPGGVGQWLSIEEISQKFRLEFHLQAVRSAAFRPDSRS